LRIIPIYVFNMDGISEMNTYFPTAIFELDIRLPKGTTASLGIENLDPGNRDRLNNKLIKLTYALSLNNLRAQIPLYK
jgi:hypothetical protein